MTEKKPKSRKKKIIYSALAAFFAFAAINNFIEDREDKKMATQGGFENVQEYELAKRENIFTKSEYDKFIQEKLAAEKKAATQGGFLSVDEYKKAQSVNMPTKDLYDNYLEQQAQIRISEEKRKAAEAEEKRKLAEAEEKRKLAEAEEKRKLAEAEEKRKAAEAKKESGTATQEKKSKAENTNSAYEPSSFTILGNAVGDKKPNNCFARHTTFTRRYGTEEFKAFACSITVDDEELELILNGIDEPSEIIQITRMQYFRNYKDGFEMVKGAIQFYNESGKNYEKTQRISEFTHEWESKRGYPSKLSLVSSPCNSSTPESLKCPSGYNHVIRYRAKAKDLAKIFDKFVELAKPEQKF